MIVKQIPVGQLAVFSYLVGCEKTKEAVVIDPGGDEDRIVTEAQKAGLTIKTIFNTHNHWDHTAGNDRLKELTGAAVVIHRLDAGGIQEVDLRLDTEKTFPVGKIIFKVFHTPGHTPGGLCLYAEGQLFTGDTLFVGDSGRTDLPNGDRRALGASIRGLMKLPDDTIVWPGHDYGPTPSSTIGWEKRNNVNAKEYGYYTKD
jgi:glyoxylase-like metal-dependent hydrolase (beta-lactamase superfamily II)